MAESLTDRVAAEVRAEMARRRMTQRQLAEIMGISQPQVMQRLTGKLGFRLSELEHLAKALDVPVARFLPADVTS
jgi:transcriptional regulator with XRE-family HTH domain